MRKRWEFILGILAVLIIVLTIGISRGYFNNMKNKTNISVGEDLVDNIKGSDIKSVEEFPDNFLNKTSEFSIEMFKRISKEENAVYSPTPLYLALGLVSNGAEGETKDEILNLLKDNEISQEELNLYYKSLISDISMDSEDMEVDIANSIWYDEGFQVNEKYLEKNKSYYDADAYKLDFTSPKAPDTINQWIREVSREKIDKMVEEMNSNAIMYLFSSIYFNGKWMEAFEKESTYEQEFYLGNGKSVEADFMHNGIDMLCLENENEQGILLPYGGDRYGFIGLLPKEEVDIKNYISNLTGDSLKDKINNMNEEHVYLSLPKFEIEYGGSLVKELKELGVKKIFDESQAELYGMGESANNLYISDIVQKTYMRVDEEGTEAASIVKVEIKESSAMIGKEIEFNRPFVYVILDLENNLPIFIGVLNNPVQ